MNTVTEVARIRAAYEKRITQGTFERYSLLIPGELYMAQRREAHILAMLRANGVTSLKDKKILEIGCGRASRLMDWARWGGLPNDLYGIDIMPELIEEAKKRLPGAHFSVADAGRTNFPDQSFDIVAQYTVFTSVKDDRMKQDIAGEMRRLVKKNGLILWYDFRYPNPKNPDVKPVSPQEVAQLFSGCRLDGRLVTLLPPLARRLARYSSGLCGILECMPLLKSHYLAILRP